MGTNFYLHRNVCPHCQRAESIIHIGKSSAGWAFSLHHHAPFDEWGTTPRLTTLEEWEAAWSAPGAKILDEYGNVIPPLEMWERITRRFWYKPHERAGKIKQMLKELPHNAPHVTKQTWKDGLLRHVGDHCVYHGKTWDMITGSEDSW